MYNMRRKATGHHASSVEEVIPEESPKEFCEFLVAKLPTVEEGHMRDAYLQCIAARLSLHSHPSLLSGDSKKRNADGGIEH